MTEHPTLHERAGDDGAFRPWLDAFYHHVEHDNLRSPPFPGGVSEHTRQRDLLVWHPYQPSTNDAP
jgi:hemoglobin